MNTPLIVIIGPTASGKSSLALQLARDFRGEIVNCDSVQVYKYLDIGTAKVSPAERNEIPHHFIDILEPHQLFTAGEFLNLGRKVLIQIQQRNHIPFVVGGTGLYLRALLEGLFEGPKRCSPLRERFDKLADRKGTPYLHRVLQKVDKASAERISSRDRPKIIRALEVFFLTSKPLSWHFRLGKKPLKGFDILKIGLNPPRQVLYKSIELRVDQMFSDGLVEEVKYILSRGFSASLRPLQSLGYSQVIRYLEGHLTYSEAINLVKRDTRRYAKRQLTWFRKEMGVQWFDALGTEPSIQSIVKAEVTCFLQRPGVQGSPALLKEGFIH
jgi:tRNA dimethylallyltransferase